MIIEKENLDYHVLNKEALALKDLGQNIEALKMIEKAIELNSTDDELWKNKGVILRALGRNKDAFDSTEKALHINPNNIKAIINKAAFIFILEMTGRYEEAIRLIEKAIILDPKNKDAWNNKAAMLIILGKNEEAIEYLDKAIEIDPDYSMALNNKGAALHNIFRKDLSNISLIDKAIKYCKKATLIDRNYVDAWYNLACFYSHKKDKKNTLLHLRKAIEINKSYKEKASSDTHFDLFRKDKDFMELILEQT